MGRRYQSDETSAKVKFHLPKKSKMAAPTMLKIALMAIYRSPWLMFARNFVLRLKTVFRKHFAVKIHFSQIPRRRRTPATVSCMWYTVPSHAGSHQWLGTVCHSLRLWSSSSLFNTKKVIQREMRGLRSGELRRTKVQSNLCLTRIVSVAQLYRTNYLTYSLKH